jgi:hypothetical protein
MSKQLTVHVHVLDDNGQAHIFGPGDQVPGWAVKKITNPHVWEDGPATGSAEQDPGSRAEGPPPMSGTGSGKEAWAAYAARNDVEVPEGAKRDDILEALQAAGVATVAETGE